MLILKEFVDPGKWVVFFGTGLRQAESLLGATSDF